MGYNFCKSLAPRIRPLLLRSNKIAKVVQMGKSNSLSRLIHSELRNQLSLSMQFKPCIRVNELTQPVKMRDHFIYNFISIKAFLLMLITF